MVRLGSRYIALTLVAAAFMLPAVANPQKKPKKNGIPWVKSMAAAKQQAAKAKKPIMADYYAEWCPPCKAMLASTYKDSRVIERAKRFVPALIDIDKHRKDADAAGIDAVPTLVFYDHTGKELMRSTGYHDADEMLKLMGEAEKKAKG